MEKKERNIRLDVYKGLLIILVVIRHVLQHSVADEGGIIANYIWAVQMPGFMLVSGYFSAKKCNNAGEILQQIKKSALHYAVPFFSWFLCIHTLLQNNYNRNIIFGLKQLLLHVDRGLWFLWVIFILSVIFTCCNYVMSNGNHRVLKTGIVLIASFGVLGAVGFLYDINFLGIKLILYYSIYYGAGWLAHRTEYIWKKWWQSISSPVVAVSLISFLSIIYNYDLFRLSDNLMGVGLRCIAGFSGNLILLWICREYLNIFTKLKLEKIGLYTLEIYVTHMNVSGLMKQGSTYGFYTVSGFENFLISLVLTVCFSIIIIAVFKTIPVADLIFFGKGKWLQKTSIRDKHL